MAKASGFGAINIDIDPRLSSLVEEYVAQVKEIVNEELLTLAVELEERSPTGATGELKGSWDVQGASRQRNSLDLQLRITNTSRAAFFRVSGRRPGRMPPSSALEPWVRKVIGISDEKKARSVAFLIARKIGKQGTDRYNSRDNILGVDPDDPNKYLPDSPVLAAQQRISDRANQISIPRRGGGRRR